MNVSVYVRPRHEHVATVEYTHEVMFAYAAQREGDYLPRRRDHSVYVSTLPEALDEARIAIHAERGFADREDGPLIDAVQGVITQAWSDPAGRATYDDGRPPYAPGSIAP